MVVVLSQIDTETLSTISVTLPGFSALVLAETVEVGTGSYRDLRPSLKVAVGALLVETRPDGAQIISSTDAVVAASVGGTFTLDGASDDEIAGTFDVDLDDGGYLAGSFVATPGG